MASSDDTPWILRINNDILGSIFLHNALHDEDFAELKCENPTNICLSTARHTSQVCSQWRSMMLDFPLLWANILDLDHLNQPNDHWRTEVMTRTKACPLSVRGHVGKRRCQDYESSFFMELLSRDWERMRRLQIVVDSPLQEDSRWEVMQKRAPNLEILVIGLPDETEPRIFLSDQLPVLREFSGASLRPAFRGTYSTSIRRLGVQTDEPCTTFLPKLAGMKNLEALTIYHLKDEDLSMAPRSIPVSLPNLTSLTTYGPLRAQFIYMAYIQNAPIRHLELMGGGGNGGPLSKEDVSGFYSLITALFRQFTEQCVFEMISFEVHYAYFIFEHPNESDIWSWPKFGSAQHQLCKIDLLYASFKGLLSGSLVGVTVLRLLIGPGQVRKMDQFDESLVKFFNALDHVTTLEIGTYHVLQLVLDIQANNGGRVVFPRLESITFKKVRFPGKMDQDFILHFLCQRRSVGVPIWRMIFDYSFIQGGQDDLAFLKGVDDLQVTTNVF